jgi:hypothetical protein
LIPSRLNAQWLPVARITDWLPFWRIVETSSSKYGSSSDHLELSGSDGGSSSPTTGSFQSSNMTRPSCISVKTVSQKSVAREKPES